MRGWADPVSLFTDAVNQLHAALGDPVSYRTPGLPAQTVDAVYRSPTEETFTGGNDTITRLHVFEVAVDAIADPAVGDQITQADGTVFEIQTKPTVDETRTTWLFDVRVVYSP
ncbi:MAG: head-tail joining protein [Geminicoccaceae bacterium]